MSSTFKSQPQQQQSKQQPGKKKNNKRNRNKKPKNNNSNNNSKPVQAPNKNEKVSGSTEIIPKLESINEQTKLPTNDESVFTKLTSMVPPKKPKKKQEKPKDDKKEKDNKDRDKKKKKKKPPAKNNFSMDSSDDDDNGSCSSSSSRSSGTDDDDNDEDFKVGDFMKRSSREYRNAKSRKDAFQRDFFEYLNNGYGIGLACSEGFIEHLQAINKYTPSQITDQVRQVSLYLARSTYESLQDLMPLEIIYNCMDEDDCKSFTRTCSTLIPLFIEYVTKKPLNCKVEQFNIPVTSKKMQIARGSYGGIYKDSEDKNYIVKTFFDDTLSYFVREMITNHIIGIPIRKIYTTLMPDFTGFAYSMLKAKSDLYDLMEEGWHTKLSEAEKLHFTKSLVAQLKLAHDNKIVHRDISASNILVFEDKDTKKYNLLLCDWGMSRLIHDELLEEEKDPEKLLTRLTDEVCTIFCRPPEVFLCTMSKDEYEDNQSKSKKQRRKNIMIYDYAEFVWVIDVWSLGCVLFQLWSNIKNWLPVLDNDVEEEEGYHVMYETFGEESMRKKTFESLEAPYPVKLLLENMLGWNPKTRWTIQQAHDWISTV